VLLDGSWSEAKTLWWRNPWLLKLRRIVLNPRQRSHFGRLRREPRREALSTLEAAALLLRALDEGGPEIEAALLGALGRLIDATARRPGTMLTGKEALLGLRSGSPSRNSMRPEPRRDTQ
jgi:DTW domain-containing protein YfiP